MNKAGGRLAPVIDSAKRRPEREPLRIGLPGLACAIYPAVIEKGLRCGEKIGIYEIDDPFAAMEVRTSSQLERIAKHLYWSE